MTGESPMTDDHHLLMAVQNVVRQLAPLIRNSYFHDLSNAVFSGPVEEFVEAVRPLVESEGALDLERLDTELFANGVRIPLRLAPTQAYELVTAELAKLGGGLRFDAGFSERGIRALLETMAEARDAPDVEVDELNQRLSAAGHLGVEFLAQRLGLEDSSGDGRLDLRGQALDAYHQVLDFIETTFRDMESLPRLNQRRAKRLVHRLVDLSCEEADGYSLFGLAAIKGHDRYTFNHMVNVCVLAIAFGQRLGFSRQDLAELGLCALYHDLGKLNVPREILNKPGKLSSAEWAIMGNHTVFGAQALFPLVWRDLRSAPRIAAVLQHHYGFSGDGYPDLRLMKNQTLFARIIAVVDLFDAMTTKRVYQEEFLPDEALRAMLRLAGEYTDPLIVRAFINCIGVFPVGSVVELSSNELAVVTRPATDRQSADRPWLRIVTDRNRSPADPRPLDLSAPEADGIQIVGCVDPEPIGLEPAAFSI